MFESFMADLVRWWSSRFRIDPAVAGAALRQPDMDVVLGKPMAPGRRVDGWEVESPMERVKREKRERRAAQREHAQEVEEAARKEVQNKRKGKDKERESASTSAAVPSSSSTSDEKPRTTSITLFGPGSTTPLYLHILPPVEPITGPSSLIERAAMRAGSRETSAQLFTTLCRAIGVPARLVISLQVAPWSVAASKVANSSVGTRTAPKEPSSGRLPRRPPKQEARKPIDEYTSDEEGSASFEIMDEMADLSGNDPFENVARRSSARSTSLKGPVAKAKRGSASRPVSIGSGSDTGSVRSAKSKGKANPNSPAAKGKGKGKGKAKATDDASEQAEQSDRDPNDYRPAKWRNLDKIVPVKPKTRLRPQKPTKSHGAADEIEIDPNSPPVMWTEVFSKPFQRWLTVDPIRGRVEPTGNRYMEPKPTDRHNKLVYVVAFEEDGYAREVTARYARSFNGRVSKMRPPARRRGEEEWWSRVVRAIHRPQRLDRDAAEDMELADAANKEPMPASVAAFKDHPTYILERHLKRDETLFPRTEVAKFQGESVFARANVVALRSVRQWWNEGREIRDGEVPLKWVKSRGYTLANKRAEEQARAEGQEAPQEGLYARFQTEIYTSPPIVDGKIPTNAFGNIDLYVPSMLPPGAAHIPYNGAAKVAKQLGINYAEAVVCRLSPLSFPARTCTS